MPQLAFTLFSAMVLSFALATSLAAQSLAVSPTKIEVAPSGQHTTMTVKSGGQGASVVQLRIFR